MPTSLAASGSTGDGGDVTTSVIPPAHQHFPNSLKMTFDQQQPQPTGSSIAMGAQVASDLTLLSGAASVMSSTQTPFCAKCNNKILDVYYLFALDKAWHRGCLVCNSCNETLDEGSCFKKRGAIYCRKDYQRLFCRCIGCDKAISEHDLIVPVVDQNSIYGYVDCLLFHLQCFECTLCHRALEPGAQFFIQGARVYCEMHYDICLSRSPLILPLAPLSDGSDRLYNMYGGSDMDTGDSKPNSKRAKSKNSSRKNSTKNNHQTPLSPMHGPLSSSSPRSNSMKVTTSLTDSMLGSSTAGSDGMTSLGIYKPVTPPPPAPLVHCPTHQGLLSTVSAHHLSSLPPRPQTELGASEVAGGAFIGGESSSALNSVDFYGSHEFGGLDGHQAGHHAGGSNSQQPSGSSTQSNQSGSQQRGKRVRTSFKHTQLKVMKQYFSQHHNPDAKDLKHLANRTGLSKRVLQVWFQNARAKYRRNTMKEHPKPSGAAMGQALLAGNPISFGVNSSLSESRAQSTSLLDGDSPLSNNSAGEGVNGMGSGISSASMTIGGDDDCLMYDGSGIINNTTSSSNLKMKDCDDFDDGFQDADDASTGDRQSRNDMLNCGKSKSPTSQSSHMNNLLMTGDLSHSGMAMTPNSYRLMESANYANQTGDFNIGHLIQPTML